MLYLLLVETAAGSGEFDLAQHDVTATSASGAIAALQPLAPPGVRIGVWPYHRMIALPDPQNAVEAEVGQSYRVLEQSAGTAGSFVLIADEVDSIADLDASVAVLQRQASTGFRTGLMLKADAAPASAPAPQPTSGTPSFATAPATADS